MLCHGQESWKLLGHMKTGLLVPSERVLRSLRF